MSSFGRVNIASRIKHRIVRGDPRSVTAKVNILQSVFYRGMTALIGLATFPLAIRYLDPALFGIFITLTSIMNWFGYLDLGLGRGLRNRLGESIAHGDTQRGRAYVSTAFFVLGGIFLGVFLVFFTVNLFLDWSSLLNVDPTLRADLAVLAPLVFGAFCIHFVFSLVYEVFNAHQKTAIVRLFELAGNVLFIIGLLFLIQFADSSLLYFGAIKSFSFAIVPVTIALYIFKTTYKTLSPAWQFVDSRYVRDLTSLGFKFFIIQVSLVVINGTNNFLIIRYVGPADVIAYNVAFKYFSLIILLFTIASNPLWTAYIEAYQKEDFAWVKRVLGKMKMIWAATVGLAAFMLLFADYVYAILTNGEVQVPFSLSVLVATSIGLAAWNTIYNLFINGTGKISLQMYTTLIGCVINIPLSIFFVKAFDLGSVGIVLGSVISLLGPAVLSPIQVSKILAKKDHGIWGK